MMRKTAVLVLATVCSQAGATNFSYSYIEAGVGKNYFDNDFFFAGDEYSDTTVLNGGFSAQFLEDQQLSPVLSARGFFESEDGANSEFESQILRVMGELPIPVADRLDIIPQLGRVWVRQEVCAFNQCQSDSDNDFAYALQGRIWVVPDTLELSAEYFDTTFDDNESSVIFRGSAWITDEADLFVEYWDFEDSDLFSVGVRAHF